VNRLMDGCLIDREVKPELRKILSFLSEIVLC
jgi:hypothetical protein